MRSFLGTQKTRSPTLDIAPATAGLSNALAVFDHDIDALEQIDMAKCVAFHGDDIGVFARAD